MPRPREIFESTDKKVCKICKEPKFLDEFTPTRGGKGGRSTDCLKCRRESPIQIALHLQRREETKRRREMGTYPRSATHNKPINPDLAVLNKLGVHGNLRYI